jgi:hypothetical protein
MALNIITPDIRQVMAIVIEKAAATPNTPQ